MCIKNLYFINYIIRVDVIFLYKNCYLQWVVFLQINKICCIYKGKNGKKCLTKKVVIKHNPLQVKLCIMFFWDSSKWCGSPSVFIRYHSILKIPIKLSDSKDCVRK